MEVQAENRILKESNRNLKMELEDLQQYTRRTNLRLHRVPKEPNERSDHVLDIVEKLFKEVDPQMFAFGSPIDRAHRIGKPRTVNGVTTQAIIIRFLTFRNRTKIYRARKIIRERFEYGISLDLTKPRLSLLNEARDMVKDIDGVQFVYTDINCFTRALLSNGEHKLFNSVSDLAIILANI